MLHKVCAIEIESFAYDTADVNFDWDSTPGGVELARSIELPQFKLQGKYKIDYTCLYLPCLKS